MKTVNEFISTVRPFDSSSVVANRVDSIEKTVVYSFDVVSGIAKEKAFNLAFPRTNKEAFQKHFVSCWYNREATKVSDKANSFEEAVKEYKTAKDGEEEENTSKINVSKEEEASLNEALKTVRANKAAFLTLFENVKAVRIDDVPFTIRIFTYAIRNEKADTPTMAYCEEVTNAIRDMRENAIDEKTNIRDLSKVKEALSKAVKNLWKEEAGVLMKYHVSVNSSMAERIWQVSYKGTAINKEGRLYSKNATSSEVVREVIFEVFKALNGKEARAKEAKEAAKEAAKDEQLAQASKPKPRSREVVKK